MELGFSFVGLGFLIMLFVPNFFWTKNQPKDYPEYAKNENRILLFLERTGEVSVTCLLLVSGGLDPKTADLRLLLLIFAFLLMLLYELFWIRYFKSEKTMKDFYSSFFGVPVAGATLPVAAVLLCAAYSKNVFLFAAGIVLGIGHIGIHLCHKREISKL